MSRPGYLERFANLIESRLTGHESFRPFGLCSGNAYHGAPEIPRGRPGDAAYHGALEPASRRMKLTSPPFHLVALLLAHMKPCSIGDSMGPRALPGLMTGFSGKMVIPSLFRSHFPRRPCVYGWSSAASEHRRASLVYQTLDGLQNKVPKTRRLRPFYRKITPNAHSLRPIGGDHSLQRGERRCVSCNRRKN